MIYIGSDHGGFKLKKDLKTFLDKEKVDYVDVGPKTENPKDDYPEFSAKVAAAVQKSPEKNLGILICRSGQGVCVAANKFKGVRAALAWNELLAKASRHDDNANVLCLPADYISEEVAQGIVRQWLNTPFSKEERHLRRLKEIANLER